MLVLGWSTTYGVDDAIDAGIIALAPVLFTMRSVINPAVEEALSCVTSQPAPFALEVAKPANT